MAVLAGTLIALGDPRLPIRPHLDTVRDQLRVRDCVERGLCTPLETTAQRDNLFHGPIWMQFLIATRRAGLDAWTQRSAVIALLGIAAAVVDAWVSSTFSASLGAIAAALFVACTLAWTNGNLLYNPAILALPCSLFYAALSGLLASGSLAWAALGGVALCLCIDVHVAGLAFLPWLAVATILAPRRPLVLFVTGMASLAIPATLLSGAVWLNNLRSVGVSVPIFAGTLVAAVAAAAIREWWLVRPAIVRQLLLVFAIGIYFGGSALLLMTLRGWVAYGNYFLFVAPVVALGGAVVLRALLHAALRFAAVEWRHRLSLAAIGCFLVVVALDCRARLQHGIAEQDFTLDDGRRLAQVFNAWDWTYSRLRFALRGPHVDGYDSLLAAIAPFMSRVPDTLRATPDDTVLRIVAADASELPRLRDLGWENVPLERGKTALIGPLHAWIRESDVRVLVDGREWTPPLARAASDGAEMISFSDWDRLPSALPLGASGSVGGDLPPGRVLTVELGIEASPPDTEHRVLMIAGCFASAWTIAGVDGISSEFAADHTSVLLRRVAPHESGAIRFTYARKSEDAAQGWNDLAPLHFVETRPGEDAIVNYLRPFGQPCR